MAEIALRNIKRRAKQTRQNQGRGYVRIRVKPIESRGEGVAGKGGAQGSPKRKTQLTAGGAEATEAQAPTSFLMLSAPLLLVRQLRLPLTDELRRIGSGAARRALVISDFPIFPPPVPRDIALKPAQGKLARCERVAGVRAVQMPHTSVRALQGASSSARAAGFFRSHACAHRKALEKVMIRLHSSIWGHSSIRRTFFL